MSVKKLHALNNNAAPADTLAAETTAEATPAPLDAGKTPRVTEPPPRPLQRRRSPQARRPLAADRRCRHPQYSPPAPIKPP